jgi:hypothetical protein
MHVFQGGIKVQETMFPGEDYKGEEPLFIFLFPGDEFHWTSVAFKEILYFEYIKL